MPILTPLQNDDINDLLLSTLANLATQKVDTSPLSRKTASTLAPTQTLTPYTYPQTNSTITKYLRYPPVEKAYVPLDLQWTGYTDQRVVL
jgi:hypothetical protein